MTIVQVPVIVPDELAPQVIAGTLKITGAVLRNKKGRIVKHLPATTLKAKQITTQTAKGAVNVVKTHPVASIGVAVGVGVVTGSSYLYYTKVKRNPAVKKFEFDLVIYLEQIQKQELTLSTIENLLEDLQDIQQKFNLEEVKFKLSAKQLNALIAMTYQYTTDLAKANNMNLSEISKPNNIVNLQEYLRIQRDIFKTA